MNVNVEPIVGFCLGFELISDVQVDGSDDEVVNLVMINLFIFKISFLY
jgi:hypothetical protein